jgi:xylan 1,4-beta-xylosidase
MVGCLFTLAFFLQSFTRSKSIGTEVQLKIEAIIDNYAFYYTMNGIKWNLSKDSINGKFHSTKSAGGFVGSVFALYTTSSGKEINNKAHFNWFEYKGDDEVDKR